jgi:hypothetical protein
MRTMRIAHALLALLLPAAISSVSSNEEPPREAAVPADSTVVAFWPRDADDTLSHARDPGEQPHARIALLHYSVYMSVHEEMRCVYEIRRSYFFSVLFLYYNVTEWE